MSFIRPFTVCYVMLCYMLTAFKIHAHSALDDSMNRFNSDLTKVYTTLTYCSCKASEELSSSASLIFVRSHVQWEFLSNPNEISLPLHYAYCKINNKVKYSWGRKRWYNKSKFWTLQEQLQPSNSQQLYNFNEHLYRILKVLSLQEPSRLPINIIL